MRVLTANDIHKSYGNLAALRGVSLHVAAGEIVGLLGPNGAGKSTFVALACGLLLPDRGRLCIAGLGAPHLPQNRRLLGVAPQELALYPDLSAVENLSLFGRLSGLHGAQLRERVQWGLRLAGLRDRDDQRVRTFSGGMARRLNLAAALLHDPAVLLLDEPTAGVDPHAKDELLAGLAELRHAGKAILYTSHDLGDMERLCDRVAILDHGQIVLVDRVERICNAVGQTHVVEGMVAGLPVSLTTAELDATLRDLAKRGPIDALTVRRPSLHEAFLQLTKESPRK